MLEFRYMSLIIMVRFQGPLVPVNEKFPSTRDRPACYSQWQGGARSDGIETRQTHRYSVSLICLGWEGRCCLGMGLLFWGWDRARQGKAGLRGGSPSTFVVFSTKGSQNTKVTQSRWTTCYSLFLCFNIYIMPPFMNLWTAVKSRAFLKVYKSAPHFDLSYIYIYILYRHSKISEWWLNQEYLHRFRFEFNIIYYTAIQE